MNAIQFIKEHGVAKVRKVIDGAPEWAMSINFNNGMYYSRMEHKKGDTFLYDIKRLVESVDLIGEYGGLYGAIDFISGYTEEQLAKPIYSPMLRLKQAIADYESIYSIPESVRQAILNLEMHL